MVFLFMISRLLLSAYSTHISGCIIEKVYNRKSGEIYTILLKTHPPQTVYCYVKMQASHTLRSGLGKTITTPHLIFAVICAVRCSAV